MGKIKILQQNLINLIAAGEVVERPASALKELLENSVDAGATNIIVNLEDYGNKLIKVKDNGIGMDKSDAHLAFKQHATSKILNEEDLHHINTMGFRGEALASISAVAEKIILETKTDKDNAVKIEVSQSNTQELPSIQTDKGTSIKIENIFKNIPARRKFLKNPTTELKYLVNSFIEVALSNTFIHFELYHNDKLIYRLTKSNNIKERIFDIFGSNIAKNLYEENTTNNSLSKIEFVIGSPEIAKKSSPIQFVYVNGRYIVSKLISSAAQEAFKGFIHRDLKPTYFIFIHIDPSKVDVNMHPRKLEIKFEDSSEIYRIIYSSIRKILENKTKSLIVDNLSISPIMHLDPQERIYNTTNESKPNISKSPSSFPVNDSGRSENKYITKPKSNKVTEALSFTQALLNTTTSPFNDLPNKSKLEISSDNLFQLFNTYILIDNSDKLVVVDQHAAAEKVLFEKLLKEYGKSRTRPLLIPQIINLNPLDKSLLLSKAGELKEIGIIIQDFGPQSISLTEIPEIITNNFNINDYIDEILQPDKDIISTYTNQHSYNEYKISKDIFIILATTACHGSIRAGQNLSKDEMSKLINNLKDLDNPYNCPHGRPTMWELSRYDLEKNFKRKI